MQRFATGTRQLRCLNGQRIAPKLVTTGALEPAPTSKEPGPSLIGAAVMFVAIIFALAAIVSAAQAGSCDLTPAPAAVER